MGAFRANFYAKNHYMWRLHPVLSTGSRFQTAIDMYVSVIEVNTSLARYLNYARLHTRNIRRKYGAGGRKHAGMSAGDVGAGASGSRSEPCTPAPKPAAKVGREAAGALASKPLSVGLEAKSGLKKGRGMLGEQRRNRAVTEAGRAEANS
ncbi:MAG: hypothetical protein MN733_35325 [Nitrososphaera sp.]|nr:hypothetical protein [Nitrososphaera sp.]